MLVVVPYLKCFLDFSSHGMITTVVTGVSRFEYLYC
jgi:hypothetical protein